VCLLVSAVWGALAGCCVKATTLYPVGGGTSVGGANTAAATAFWAGPGNVTWTAFGVTDISGDHTAGGGLYDLVGDSSNAGLYWASTNAYVFFRMRVDAGVVATLPEWSGSHFLVIDVVGVGNNGIDYGFGWDGANAANVLEHGLEMQKPTSTSFSGWDKAKMDDIDNSAAEKTSVDINGLVSTGVYRTTDGYVRTTDGQSTTNFGTTTLVDFAVSWSYLQANVPTLYNNRDWKVAVAAVNAANDHTTFNEIMSSGLLTGAVTGSPAWSSSFNPIPEPTSSLVGMLIAAGVLRRRRE
jgi:hypothetical protein